MLTMSEVNCIKVLRNQKSLSINAIHKMLGINWRTAKKYADGEDLPEEKVVKKEGMMHEEQWGEIVADWLWEDEKLKKKQRRTNKKMFQDLKAMEFPGSYRTVCYFIKEWREGREDLEEETQDKNAERLEHPPGEAQLDFGLMEAVKEGKYVDVHALVLSLPFSNAAYAIPLPGENQECFLQGMKMIFNQLGEVPRKIRIDNLKAAVIRPRGRHEEAVFTDEFLRFANHYGFEPQACNPAAGYEKGNVENKVGYVRYNFITPAPVIENLDHLTDLLKDHLEKDRERTHYKKQVPIKDLLEEESQYLLALPEEEYPVFKEEKAKANKYGEILLDQVGIYIPKGANFSQLSIIKYWDRFKVVSPHGEILYDDFRPYMHRNRKIPWDGILRAWVSKPRAVPYSRFAPYLPGRIREYLAITDLAIRKERLRWLIATLVLHDMEEISERFYELLSEQTEEMKEPADHPFDVDWSIYDQLQSPADAGGEVG
ncbi:transposase [Bacillus sp. 17376]|uniref:Transposase n=1 Tax=Mesobacillus boroniphilus JCM 21738 TaxID=1294265 RepID=W4RXR4_9BACI|nr:IS21 family transposase [Mesobacillus boroniphilus]ESU31663.1 transposase [Bacillus sp. 17376]GAE48424.1 transposase [Mesobacillus boroniphilus JCM 21738]